MTTEIAVYTGYEPLEVFLGRKGSPRAVLNPMFGRCLAAQKAKTAQIKPFRPAA